MMLIPSDSYLPNALGYPHFLVRSFHLFACAINNVTPEELPPCYSATVLPSLKGFCIRYRAILLFLMI